MKIVLISKRMWVAVSVIAFWFNLSLVVGQDSLGEKPVKEAEDASPAETPSESPKEKPAATKPAKGILEMTDEEKAAAGLEKLSPAELEYLDEWLRNKRQAAEKKAAEEATEKAKVESAKVESEVAKKAFLQDKDYALVSRVDGTMIPLTGRTVVRLEDGTKWKQANKEDRFTPRVKDRPAAAVFHTQFGYKMRIEGMPDFFVDPVREK